MHPGAFVARAETNMVPNQPGLGDPSACALPFQRKLNLPSPHQCNELDGNSALVKPNHGMDMIALNNPMRGANAPIIDLDNHLLPSGHVCHSAKPVFSAIIQRALIKFRRLQLRDRET